MKPLTTILAPAALAGALLLSACSGQPAATITHPTAAPAAASTSTAAATPAAPKTATWGDTITLPSGVAITLNYVGLMPATQYTDPDASGHPTMDPETAVFSVKVTNGSKQSVAGSFFDFGQPTATYGPDGVQAKGNGWDGYSWPNMTTINPGESQTAQVGFDVPPAGRGDVRVEFDVPQYIGGAPAVFKGAVK